MSVMPEGVRPRGALLECFIIFPQFLDDLELLVHEGYMKVTGPESCEWLKSKTSLAEYFKWAGDGTKGVPGGFWAPIEKAFGIRRHCLRKLAGNNANILKPPESRAFRKIKPKLKEHWIQERKKEKERQVFMYIKHLIFSDADPDGDNEEPDKIHEIFEKISDFFCKNCGQKQSNP
jgi:hypothetical protein